MTDNIENRPLPGVTPKLVWGALAAWTTIIVAVLGSYQDIKSQFKDEDKTNSLQEVRIEALKTEIDVLKLNLKTVEDHANLNAGRIAVLEFKIDEAHHGIKK